MVNYLLKRTRMLLLIGGSLVLGGLLVRGASVTLAWSSTPDPSVVGYKVYEGVASRSYTNVIDVGNSTQATISGLVPGTTYYFAVTSYTAGGLESAFSGEIAYTPPIRPQLQLVMNVLKQPVLTATAPIGYKYNVLSSADLQTWTPLTNLTVGVSGVLSFADLSLNGTKLRFYRLQQTSP